MFLTQRTHTVGVPIPTAHELRRLALQRSWSRDQFARRWRLVWRWALWAFARFGCPLIAAMLLLSSTPWHESPLMPNPTNDSHSPAKLELKPSLQLTIPSLEPTKRNTP